MKSTGIVRRVDDLGRVVIPKEIRRAMGIHEGDPLEIFVDKENKAVSFVKYQPDDTDIHNQATEWLRRNKTYLDIHYARFTIEGYVVSCEGVVSGKRVQGSTKCNPKDTFDPSVGMVYAASRAFDLDLPGDWN